MVAADRVLARRVGEDTVILDVDGNTYYSLGEVGSLVWELLAQPRTIDEVCEAVIDRYDVESTQCHADVEALLADLLAHGLACESPSSDS